jgi:branched-chain amino acid transport system ATP-binding protein
MTNALDASAITVRYGGNLAVDGVDVEVPAGKMIGVVGANGAGKSTLVNSFAGWSRGRLVAKGPAATMKDDPRILDAYLGSLKT